MQMLDLPSRRSEAWKWSDLRAAMAGQENVLIGSGELDSEGPISALAQIMGDAYGPSALDIVAPGETFESKLTEGDAGQYGTVVVRAGATATLVERLGVSGSRLRPFLPSYSRIEVEPGATLVRIVVQANAVPAGEADAAIVLNEAVVKLGKVPAVRAGRGVATDAHGDVG